MSFKKIQITNSSDLDNIKSVLNNQQNTGRWVYRGHADSKWLLLSKFERYCNNYGARDRAGDIEKNILREFRSMRPKYNLQIPPQLDRLQETIFLQHNGCATRLLDITTNFWVACFFALHDIGILSQNQTCCVWCFKRQKILDSIASAGYSALYSDLTNFDLHPMAADNFIETAFTGTPSVLLIGNLVDSDHQRCQDGKFLLALDTSKNTFEQIFSIYAISNAMLNAEAENYDFDSFAALIENNDVIQVLITGGPLSVECEKRILCDNKRVLSSLFKNGIKSELADLNYHFKF